MNTKRHPEDEPIPRKLGIPGIALSFGFILPFVPGLAAMNEPNSLPARWASEFVTLAVLALVLRYGLKPRARAKTNGAARDCWLFVIPYVLIAAFMICLSSREVGPAGVSTSEIAMMAVLGLAAGLVTILCWTPTEPKANSCVNCMFDLAGLTPGAKCPECGKERCES